MKILVVCQHYWPEPYPLQDYCEELVKRGHNVLVITGIPNYPMGEIYDDYKKNKNRIQMKNGVRICRTFTIPRKHNIMFRLLNYFSYAISSSMYIKKMKEEFDVVYTCQSSPVMMSSAAIKYAKKNNKKVILYCLDLWPASLKAGGIREKSFIYKIFKGISKKIYTNVDKILVTSKLFISYFKDQFEIDENKIIYMPQYADSFFENMDEQEKTNLDKKTYDIVFAGNIGVAQSMETIINAAEMLEDYPQIKFHIVGDGSELNHTKNMAKEKNLNNIIFYGRKPKEEMVKYYLMADAMLVTLFKDELISCTLPGKVQTYMAAGKTIIASADGETRDIINDSQCGLCVPSEDYEKLARAIQKLFKEKDNKEYCNNAKRYYQKYFSRERFISQLEMVMKNEMREE